MPEPTLAQLNRVASIIEANPHCQITYSSDRKNPNNIRLRMKHRNGVTFKTIWPNGYMKDTTPTHYLRKEAT